MSLLKLLATAGGCSSRKASSPIKDAWNISSVVDGRSTAAAVAVMGVIWTLFCCADVELRIGLKVSSPVDEI